MNYETFSQQLSEIINLSGIKYKENKISYIFDCPRCRRKDKLYIRRKDGRFVCWYCREIDNFQGRAEYALCELLSQPIQEIKKTLYGEIPLTSGSFVSLEIKDWFGDDDEIPNEANELKKKIFDLDFYPIDHTFSKKGLEYLIKRGIDLKLAKKYNIHYCPPTRRVIFPVEYHGSLFGWQARTIVENRYFDEEKGEIKEFPKILTSEGLLRDRILMFMDRLDNSNHCILTEGPISAIKADLCGGNVATMGKAVSIEQINLIRNAGIEKIYLALDPDAAREVSRLVSSYKDLQLFYLLPNKGQEDLGVMTPEEVLMAFKNAPRINDSKVFIYLN